MSSDSVAHSFLVWSMALERLNVANAREKLSRELWLAEVSARLGLVSMSELDSSGRERRYDELRVRFTYHEPKAGQPERYQKLRAAALELAELIDSVAPESREKSLAFTSLEQSVMWANAAIARRE